jgi:hypothetical protein
VRAAPIRSRIPQHHDCSGAPADNLLVYPLAEDCVVPQAASETGNAAGLVFFLFDLLYLDGDDVSARPLIERKARLAALMSNVGSPLQYSDHQNGVTP